MRHNGKEAPSEEEDWDLLCRHHGREESLEGEESMEEEDIMSFKNFGITLKHSSDILWWRRMHQYEKKESSKEE